MRLAFFGTGIVQHLEGFVPELSDPDLLPKIGDPVLVEDLRPRGFVHQLALRFQARWPFVLFHVDNFGISGATSYDLVRVVKTMLKDVEEDYDLVFFEAGINDVLRRYQGKPKEAVSIEDFEKNYREALSLLSAKTKMLVCLGEPPVGREDAVPMNLELVRYNDSAARIAWEMKADFIDLWEVFGRAAEGRRSCGAPLLWSNGIHLSEDGDATVAMTIEDYLRGKGIGMA